MTFTQAFKLAVETKQYYILLEVLPFFSPVFSFILMVEIEVALSSLGHMMPANNNNFSLTRSGHHM